MIFERNRETARLIPPVLGPHLEEENAVIMMSVTSGLGAYNVTLEDAYAFAYNYFDMISYIPDGHPVKIMSF